MGSQYEGLCGCKDHRRAALDLLFGIGSCSRRDPGYLAGFMDDADGSIDDGLHFGMRGPVQKSHGQGKVARPDHAGVQTLDGT